jgi:hypothetical protein
MLPKLKMNRQLLYIIGHMIFVGLALPSMNYGLMIPSYAIRGFGYPLFAYSFLVWVALIYNSVPNNITFRGPIISTNTPENQDPIAIVTP